MENRLDWKNLFAEDIFANLAFQIEWNRFHQFFMNPPNV